MDPTTLSQLAMHRVECDDKFAKMVANHLCQIFNEQNELVKMLEVIQHTHRGSHVQM